MLAPPERPPTAQPEGLLPVPGCYRGVGNWIQALDCVLLECLPSPSWQRGSAESKVCLPANLRRFGPGLVPWDY
ncbi:Hypp2347 [Branchiostoma lanceolatum]|uniref:Hypp2347 protein n=1 Tax=Branchiostoma lanceolatum TaxID=7740 RepID=A0A8K0EPG8_BRALA|nr:Hypp2347 [Branchiostoma lanceolatum]